MPHISYLSVVCARAFMPTSIPILAKATTKITLFYSLLNFYILFYHNEWDHLASAWFWLHTFVDMMWVNLFIYLFILSFGFIFAFTSALCIVHRLVHAFIIPESICAFVRPHIQPTDRRTGIVPGGNSLYRSVIDLFPFSHSLLQCLKFNSINWHAQNVAKFSGIVI